MNTTRSPIYREYIKTISKNKNVVDLACGDGWAGKIALECGAKSVTFADARIESFVEPVGYSNYQQQFIDLNFPQSLKPLLLKTDIVFYFGHLYHCNNHEEILNSLINSNCKDFFIDTKIGLGDPHIDLDIPTIFWTDLEPVNHRWNAWHSTESYINTGKPNLSWMLDYFNRNKLEIKLQKSVDNIFIRPQHSPYYHRSYMFHITNPNIDN